MGSIGAPELIVIALIALLLFGAGRIADIGKGLGQGIKNFKQGIKEGNEDDEEEDEKPAKKASKSEKSEKSEKSKKEEAAEEA
ncbi:MAG: twin-arginine translocase TatA/TatE family subunit [Deltaproteobacteria bacterium]|nr:twin-arginine translocase TatA/TatE family subunit [Deltaproteobacteria bacterium]